MFARLRIHHKQIRPGRALYRFRAWRCRAVSSPGDTARGPTKDMSPFNMLKSTGMRRRKREYSFSESPRFHEQGLAIVELEHGYPHDQRQGRHNHRQRNAEIQRPLEASQTAEQRQPGEGMERSRQAL